MLILDSFTLFVPSCVIFKILHIFVVDLQFKILLYSFLSMHGIKD